MKLVHKFMVTTLALFILLIGVSLFSYNVIVSVDYYRGQTEKSEKILLSMTNLRAQVRNQLLETYETAFVTGYKGFENDILKEQRLVEDRIKDLRENLTDDQVLELENSYKEVNHELVAVLKSPSSFAKLKILKVREDKFNNGFIKKISVLIDERKKISRSQSINLDLSIKKLKTLIATFVVFCFLFGVLFCLVFYKSIGKRLYNIEIATQKIADGVFNFELSEDGKDEISTLSKAFNSMKNSLSVAQKQVVDQQEIIANSSKMSALGEMSGGIAHEINTPLTSIILTAELIQDYNKTKLLNDEYLEKKIKKIIEIGQRISLIIKSLKSYSRDATLDELKCFSVNELVDSVLSLCLEKFKNNKIEIRIDRRDFETEVFGQIVPLSQVLLNLLNNSFFEIKRMEEKWIHINVIKSSDSIQLRVTDSGKGISAEIGNKIFEPFFTTKSVGQGTGLGLSLSSKIVKSHGGELYLDFESRNTCFVVSLPINKK